MDHVGTAVLTRVTGCAYVGGANPGDTRGADFRINRPAAYLPVKEVTT
ncbi:MAG: hypothetical protein ACYCX3_09420 [Thermoleophilia bacterium]